MYFEIRRKLFHLLALFYVVGVMILPRQQFVAIVSSLLVVDVVLEVLRLKNAVVGNLFARIFGSVLREQEQKKFSGVLWMLLGILVTALLISPKEVVATIYLYLIIGDAAASLVGKGFGGPKWSNSKKSVSGSAACLLACLLIGLFFLRPLLGWSGVLVGAVAATSLEFGFFMVNDNFSIPVGTSLVFMLVYGLRPSFL